ncbi:winged helix family two component transcriptional regulator [Desulfitobacterium sp. LBE]|uniref:Stage 0 sporulation protein A homolog n=1 Tax=Desulfitobacterium hafniense TaxID=49338 RepID=A0A098AZL6_DESHA|nr:MULTISPECIES: response regulator transcription factor [Desulfitobacterium]KTE90468.1 PhoB family transcriptional regulator [Desulfitobacterium hafniense]MEA5021725.1 response regulator transcription factor [Desulfitobacterium hafniense]TWH56883.1 winged helix family two component transcriptional regulator [Desulfitobacterium sp. LBE]CDX01066.1 Response regulator ArlR [Desulfitobacterium hafniense]
MNQSILIIEDEEKIARFVELELGYEGYNVTKAFDGRTGLELAETGRFDLILLDVMLPKLNGTEVLRRIRRTSAVPIIMLTARDSVMDKVSGLDSGANDYITKPFAIEELLARIRNALRNTAPLSSTEVLSASGLELDADRRTVTMRGKPVDLTKREFDLLHFLLKNKGIVLSRESLLENVWGFDFAGDTNAVDVYIRFLRGKIDEVFNLKFIHTVRGVGYVIKDDQ